MKLTEGKLDLHVFFRGEAGTLKVTVCFELLYNLYLRKSFLGSNLVAIMLWFFTGIPLGAAKGRGGHKEGEEEE